MDYLQYLNEKEIFKYNKFDVLNLIINGLPSIHISDIVLEAIAFSIVLNLIINGLPSILCLIRITGK